MYIRLAPPSSRTVTVARYMVLWSSMSLSVGNSRNLLGFLPRSRGGRQRVDRACLDSQSERTVRTLAPEEPAPPGLSCAFLGFRAGEPGLRFVLLLRGGLRSF